MRLLAAISFLLTIFSLTVFATDLLANENNKKTELQDKITTLQKEGKFEEALALAKQLLALVKTGSKSKPYEIADAERRVATLTHITSLPEPACSELTTAFCLGDSAEALYSIGDYQGPSEKTKKRVDIFKKHLGDEHEYVASCLHALAEYYIELGDNDRAETNINEALAMRRKLLGDEHPDVADSMNMLATVLFYKGNRGKEEELCQEALEMNRKLLGEEHENIADCLNNLGHLRNRQGKRDDAERLFREALAMYQKLLGDRHAKALCCRNDLAIVLGNKGDIRGAEKIFREVLQVRREVLGNKHPHTANSLNNLAWFIKLRRGFAEAKIYQREAYEMLRDIWGKENRYTIMCMENLAELHKLLGEWEEAEQLYQEAYSIQRHKFGDDHATAATILTEMAQVLNHKGDDLGAEQINRKALAMLRKNTEGDSYGIAKTLRNLSETLADQGNYAAAEPLARESLAMVRRLYPDHATLVANFIGTLGSILLHQRASEEAEELLSEGVAMCRKKVGNRNSSIAYLLNYLAIALDQLGRHDEAKALFRDAIAIEREIADGETTFLAGHLRNLAAHYSYTRQHHEAVEILRELLPMYRRLLGDKNEHVADAMSYLGINLAYIGDVEGVECLREALDMRRELLGSADLRVTITLYCLGSALYQIGEYEEAEAILTEAVGGYAINRIQAGMGIARAEFFRSPYPWLAATKLKLEKTDKAWPYTEQSLGHALIDMLVAAEGRSLTTVEQAEEKDLQYELTSAEQELTAQRQRARKDSTAEAAAAIHAARSRLEAAQLAWLTFQHKMAEKYPVSEGQAYTLSHVQRVLEPDEAVIGWLDVGFLGSKKEAWVYVIRKKGPVEWASIDLGDNSSGELQQEFRDELEWPTREVSARVTELSRDVARERILPILNSLEGVTRLVVIPSGPMLGVPVEALLDEDGRPLAERFEISYIPSATVYTWMQEKWKDHKRQEEPRMLLVGDPPFCDAHRAAMVQEQREPAATAPVEVATVRGALAGYKVALTSLPRLPASRDEVTAISALVPGASVLVGAEASEQNIRGMAESGELGEYGVIHVATHAFVDPERPKHCALVLSQVDLPDAFEAAANSDPIYDGIVTAVDIVREWKLDADLVTLSACETGLGKKVSGEGYVGFMHAFLQAGARSLLVSLWKVDDRATSLLMQRFYENYLGKRDQSMTKACALQEAKNWLRTYKDDGGQLPYAHPAYWSGFILVGDRE